MNYVSNPNCFFGSNGTFNINRTSNNSTKMKIYYLLDYLPSRYRKPTPAQEAARQLAFKFKRGDCPGTIIKGLAACINQHKGTNTVVCSVPASARDRTLRRYNTLGANLTRMTGVPFSFTAISKVTDSQPGHIAGRSSDPAAGFRFDADFFSGKDVILLDDILTSGNTMGSTARRLIERGARSVVGLVLARTINPDWPGPDNRNVERVMF